VRRGVSTANLDSLSNMMKGMKSGNAVERIIIIIIIVIVIISPPPDRWVNLFVRIAVTGDTVTRPTCGRVLPHLWK
jgi:hypothetical protein